MKFEILYSYAGDSLDIAYGKLNMLVDFDDDNVPLLNYGGVFVL